MLTFRLCLLGIALAIVGIFTSTELMAAGIILAVIAYTALVLSHIDTRSHE
ncbi:MULTISPECIES: hypothetical protein [unclassified Cryobacterium]|uniref:hypothetical protein n=1 Tax=unclassified Cryobacterium TaxID=2649013 RepID=UPI00141BDB6F|nr:MULTISPECIES: hypothetical protein [unclassified Cryobacterium]